MNAQNLFLAEAAPAAAPATTAAPAAANTTATVAVDGNAPAEQPQPGIMDGLMGMLPFIIVIVVMFYLMSRSQKKEQKRRQDMINALKKGDSVLTVGGIWGEVAEIKDDRIVLKVADNVKITMAKNAVSSVVNPGMIEQKAEKK